MPTKERTWEKLVLLHSRAEPLLIGKSQEDATCSLLTPTK